MMKYVDLLLFLQLVINNIIKYIVNKIVKVRVYNAEEEFVEAK